MIEEIKFQQLAWDFREFLKFKGSFNFEREEQGLVEAMKM